MSAFGGKADMLIALRNGDLLALLALAFVAAIIFP